MKSYGFIFGHNDNNSWDDSCGLNQKMREMK
jgi:hypothetical protein